MSGTKGLFDKYTISKTDGSPVDKDAIYFVLRIDTDEYARIALESYADAVYEDGNWIFANQLYNFLEMLKAERAAKGE